MRDPTEFRRLYKEWRARTDEYNAMIEEIFASESVPDAHREAVTDRLNVAYDAFMAEGQHFIRWKKA